jgi:hypothetical protein
MRYSVYFMKYTLYSTRYKLNLMRYTVYFVKYIMYRRAYAMFGAATFRRLAPEVVRGRITLHTAPHHHVYHPAQAFPHPSTTFTRPNYFLA